MKLSSKISLPTSLLFVLTGCAGMRENLTPHISKPAANLNYHPPETPAPPDPLLMPLPGSDGIRVGKSDPPEGYRQVANVTVSDGSGCGGFGRFAGTLGTFDHAMIKLKNEGVKAGADYIQMLTITEPHMESLCLRGDYTISAIAFQAPSGVSGSPDQPKSHRHGAIISDVDAPSFRHSVNKNDFALIVGVEKYSNELPEAEFAERDAQAVKQNLIDLGYPERNIKYLTGQRASLSALSAYIEDWLPRNVTADSRVFFYFSGHGAPDASSNQAYLVPADGDPTYLDKTAFPVKRLYADLNSLKAKQVIVALDSCFSGAGGRSVLADGARPLLSKVDEAVPRGKILLFAAASPTQITSTMMDQGHGSFTYFFLKGLGGGAKDKSGIVTPQGLYDYLKPKVQDAASRQNRDQTPVMEGKTVGELARFN